MRDRRRHLFLLGVILAALIGALLLEVPGSPAHRSATLGLDLRGGLEVVLEAVPPKGHTLTSSDLDRSVSIMRDRIDKLGVSEPEIRKQEPNQIVIQLAGVHDPAAAAKIIGQTAQLELYDLEADLTGPSIDAQGNPIGLTSLFKLLSPEQAKAQHGTPSAYYLFHNTSLVRNGGPESSKSTLVRLRDQLVAAARRKLGTKKPGPRSAANPASYTILAVPEHTVVVTCGGPKSTDTFCIGSPVPPNITTYYLFKHDPAKGIPELTGSELKASGTQQDFDQLGQPIVRIAFTGKGDRAFQDVTRRLYERGQQRGRPQHFAIVLDDDMRSSPQIDYTDSTLSNGISGGAQITGIGSLKEAKDLALVLQTGALPVSFKQVERTDVSSTLGADSLRQAKTAAIVGLLIVALFLLVLYRFLGVIAVAGLAIYAAFLYAAVLLLNVTVTLPGFAGLILTIGVAADANVVIFERIKEEVRFGKSVRSAIATGYQKGFHTIVDANVVTAITALVLFAVATAQVKGFALMLLIGTVISLVTAVAATRAMLGLLAGFRWFDNPVFLGASQEQRGRFLQIDFMRRRYLWFAISGAIIVVGAVSLGVQSLNFGIDFRGGTQVSFKTPQPVSLSKVRDQTSAIGRSDAEVQGKGPAFPKGSENYKQFQLRMKSLSTEQQNTLTSRLETQLRSSVPDIKTVSSSFSRQIARAAILAIIVSLALIVIYIALRFDLKYAIPVIVAMLHDIAITVGVYSLSQREVTTATIAAVLTVLGYSIYDTIIIFDRIRENVPRMRRASFATIANVSLWETIRRSLATTFITLLPIGSLLLFGGATLKDFAFALLVGIISGAYSSIFIAAPLLTIFKEREPEFRRRLGADVVERGVGGAVAAEPVAALAEANGGADDDGEQPGPAVVLPSLAAPAGDGATSRSQAKRERRRQRRRSRPHGRAR
ncbi:MAG TPA: protein translocase subunit SecD [Gaiellaceae bacterium]|nr:protein translocase subunit SecD [Gaiellaceae bacterium]